MILQAAGHIASMDSSFALAVRCAAVRPEVRRAIYDLYQSLQSRIDIRRPICKTSGRCCHFDEFGHRLYITTAELATFFHDLPPRPIPSPRSLPILKKCPYQLDGLCSVHAIRPFGCRIFFCDETSADWQHQQYEIFHRQLQEIHDQFEIPYFYMEWRSALAALGL
jgi:Fe-S-cluster containining protein